MKKSHLSIKKYKFDSIKVQIEPSFKDKVKVIDDFISWCAENNNDANYEGSYLAYKRKLEIEEFKFK